MAVTKEIEHLGKSNIRLKLTVPRDDVRAQYQEMLRDYTQKLQLPGFRKGKVPSGVLERKFAETLKQDALGRIIESALHEVFKVENLSRNERPLPYSTPALEEAPKLDLDQDLSFSVVYDMLPEVKIGQWKGLSVEYPYAEIEDEDINRELEGIRERNAFVMDRDDGAAAQKGDVVTIDYALLDENGETRADFKREGYAFTLGSNSNNYQFDDDILGMKKNETKECEKKFPADFFEPALAGQTGKIRITLTEVKEKKLPELDDDLAQDIDEKFNSLDDLKNSIRERLGKSLEMKQKELKINELMKKIMENTPVILPESMLQAEVNNRLQKLARIYNVDVDTLKKIMASEEKLKETEAEWRSIAEKALHSRLIIETLIEEQNFTVTDEDVERELEQIAADSGTGIEEVRNKYDDEALFYLREEIKERRIIGLLLAENTLKPGKKEKYLDLMTDNS